MKEPAKITKLPAAPRRLSEVGPFIEAVDQFQTELEEIQRQPTRFDVARQEACERATLEMAANLLKGAGDKLARAQALLNTAAGSDPAPRHTAREQAVKSIEQAYFELGEVFGELRGGR